jgi:hypothetical protein
VNPIDKLVQIVPQLPNVAAYLSPLALVAGLNEEADYSGDAA